MKTNMGLFTRLKQFIKRKPFWYRIADTKLYQLLMNSNGYKKYLAELQFYRSVLGTSSELIFDVGAHVGTKSKMFSRLSKAVISFEPDRRNIQVLKARLKRNKNCIVHNCALSSEESTSAYYSYQNDSAYNSLSEKHVNTVMKNRGIVGAIGELDYYEVNTKTLDAFIQMYGQPNYIKIDVEGFEKEVIHGLSHPVDLVSIEANLPEFLPETIEIIDFFDTALGGNYIFNYAVDDRFMLTEFVPAFEIRDVLNSVKDKSIEVYCKQI